MVVFCFFSFGVSAYQLLCPQGPFCACVFLEVLEVLWQALAWEGLEESGWEG